MAGGTARTRRRAAVGSLAALLVLAVPLSAAGSTVVKGAAAGTEDVTGAAWGVSSSPTSFTWDLIGGSQTATVANDGTVALTQISYTVMVSAGLGLTTFSLAVCSVAWSGGLCSGGAGTAIGGTYGINSVTTVASSVVPPVGGHVYLKATASGITVTSITMTLSLAVTGSNTPASTQLRSAVTTNQ
ncbi:MAG TPA: hypothetical protein VEI83_10645 [Acidimicrobiales bacterium]|nr:hypothetical protein [Acidimicrobiales bacterium]